MSAPELLHASCVAIGGRALLIEGPSGSGKSDLALRLIDRGAKLVSDDQVMLRAEQGILYASAPATIAGKMEVRGIGIVAMEHVENMPVALFIQLQADIERMPLEMTTRMLAGVAVPAMALAPFEASAPLKAELALREFGR